MAATKKKTFDQQLESLEALVARLEEGGLPLDETLTRYEEGVKLLAELEKQLGDAEQRLTVIRKQADGTVTEEPLEAKE